MKKQSTVPSVKPSVKQPIRQPSTLVPSRPSVGDKTSAEDKDEEPPKKSNKIAKPPVSDLLGLGSININSFQALTPVLSAMAGLIQNNLKASKRNDTATTTTSKPFKIQVPPAVDVQNRSPIYIPVGDIEVAESQNIATFHITEQVPWNQAKGQVLGKPTHESPLLNGGIPISPGEVITANSDVIVGKPGRIGPRIPAIPLSHEYEGNEVPIGMKPPPIPNVLPMVDSTGATIVHAPSKDDYVGPPPPKVPVRPPNAIRGEKYKFTNQRHIPLSPPPLDQTQVDLKPPLYHDREVEFDQKISGSESLHLNGAAIQHAGEEIVKGSNFIPHQDHGYLNYRQESKGPYQIDSKPQVANYPGGPNAQQGFNIQDQQVPNNQNRLYQQQEHIYQQDFNFQQGHDPKKQSSNYHEIFNYREEYRPNRNGDPTNHHEEMPPLILGKPINDINIQPSVLNEPLVLPEVVERSTGQPLLVNIQPSQVAFVNIPHNRTTALIFGGSTEPHRNGQYFDDPSPYPEPEFSGIESYSKGVPKFASVYNQPHGMPYNQKEVGGVIKVDAQVIKVQPEPINGLPGSKAEVINGQNGVRINPTRPNVPLNLNLDFNVNQHDVNVHVPPISFGMVQQGSEYNAHVVNHEEQNLNNGRKPAFDSGSNVVIGTNVNNGPVHSGGLNQANRMNFANRPNGINSPNVLNAQNGPNLPNELNSSTWQNLPLGLNLPNSQNGLNSPIGLIIGSNFNQNSQNYKPNGPNADLNSQHTPPPFGSSHRPNDPNFNHITQQRPQTVKNPTKEIIRIVQRLPPVHRPKRPYLIKRRPVRPKPEVADFMTPPPPPADKQHASNTNHQINTDHQTPGIIVKQGGQNVNHQNLFGTTINYKTIPIPISSEGEHAFAQNSFHYGQNNLAGNDPLNQFATPTEDLPMDLKPPNPPHTDLETEDGEIVQESNLNPLLPGEVPKEVLATYAENQKHDFNNQHNEIFGNGRKPVVHNPRPFGMVPVVRPENQLTNQIDSKDGGGSRVDVVPNHVPGHLPDHLQNQKPNQNDQISNQNRLPTNQNFNEHYYGNLPHGNVVSYPIFTNITTTEGLLQTIFGYNLQAKNASETYVNTKPTPNKYDTASDMNKMKERNDMLNRNGAGGNGGPAKNDIVNGITSTNGLLDLNGTYIPNTISTQNSNRKPQPNRKTQQDRKPQQNASSYSTKVTPVPNKIIQSNSKTPPTPKRPLVTSLPIDVSRPSNQLSEVVEKPNNVGLQTEEPFRDVYTMSPGSSNGSVYFGKDDIMLAETSGYNTTGGNFEYNIGEVPIGNVGGDSDVVKIGNGGAGSVYKENGSDTIQTINKGNGVGSVTIENGIKGHGGLIKNGSVKNDGLENVILPGKIEVGVNLGNFNFCY